VHANVERQDDGAYRVVVNGHRVVVAGESYTFASAVAAAINHPLGWMPTEAYEIAEAVRRDLQAQKESICLATTTSE